MIKCTVTKVIIVVSVIVVGVFNIHFEPEDLVAECRDLVVEAHLVKGHEEDDIMRNVWSKMIMMMIRRCRFMAMQIMIMMMWG